MILASRSLRLLPQSNSLNLPLQVAELVGTACQRLTAANVPHNLFIADCGARIFLFPNCFAEKKALGQIPEGEVSRLHTHFA